MHALRLAETMTPHELASALSGSRGLAWLDGVASHRDGRFSFLAVEPCETIVVPLGARDPLASFERLERRSRAQLAAGSEHGLKPSDVPEWIGYVAYDACHAPVPAGSARSSTRPALAFARYDALVAFDHELGRTWIVGDDAIACERLRARIDAAPPQRLEARVGEVSVTPADRHRAAIARALEHIARGDIYQINLARSFHAAFEGAPLALFLALRAASPVPFGFYFEHGGRAVLARTMERFLRWQRGARTLCTRPIKGTLARAGDRDHAEAIALQSDPKECAEHAMIVDLMRNDFGRIAELGSVAVESLLAVEPYAKLSHLVSTVVCRTRPEVQLRDVLEATFPPGSVTGAPKQRAIALIEAIEQTSRDVYTGAVGFVDREGGVSLAVAIRTAVVEAGAVRYFAGGGIVEASVIERELEETELKAQVFFDALALIARRRALDLSDTAVSR